MSGKRVPLLRMDQPVGALSRMAAEALRAADAYVGFFHSAVKDEVHRVPPNTYLFQMSGILEQCFADTYDQEIYDTFTPGSRERLLAYLEGRQEDPILANMILYGPGDEYFTRRLTYEEEFEDEDSLFGVFLAEDGKDILNPETDLMELTLDTVESFHTHHILSVLVNILKPTAEKPLLFALIGCANYEVEPLHANVLKQINKSRNNANRANLLERYLRHTLNTEFLNDVADSEETQRKRQRQRYEQNVNTVAPSVHPFGPEALMNSQSYFRRVGSKVLENQSLPSVENVWLQIPAARKGKPQGYGLLVPDGAGALHAVEVNGKAVFRRVEIPDAIVRAGLNERFVQVTDPQYGAMPYKEWMKIHEPAVGNKRKKTRKRRS